jgi:two-component system, OmpR family, sensor kinase
MMALPAFLRPLHVRLTVVSLVMLLLLGCGLWALVARLQAQSAQETTQRLGLGLAQYVVAQQKADLVDAQGKVNHAAMNELAMHVMMVNPAVEVYLLDPQGRVVGHALEGAGTNNPLGRQVDVARVQGLVGAKAGGQQQPRLPWLGDDPLVPNRPNIVSVAALGDAQAPRGYVYVVLQGQAQQRVAASLGNSSTLRALAWSAAALTLVLAALLVWALNKITWPLRALTEQAQSYRAATWQHTALPGTADAPARATPWAPGLAPAHGDDIEALRAVFDQLQQRVDHQFRLLESADQQRRELVSNISHDLRTPLSNIKAYVETVLTRAPSLPAHEQADLLATALRHADLLGKRVSDLFELSKLDAGRVAPQVEVFCLAELLQDVVQNYRLQAEQRGVQLQLSVGNHRQAMVLADIALIERVLQNLVDNALRYTAAGGRVDLVIEAHEQAMRIVVMDSGRGIAREQMPYLFERYWRADDVKDLEPGTSAGLGLAIVKRILELHGSVLQVTSELAHGTQVTFSLPRAA